MIKLPLWISAYKTLKNCFKQRQKTFSQGILHTLRRSQRRVTEHFSVQKEVCGGADSPGTLSMSEEEKRNAVPHGRGCSGDRKLCLLKMGLERTKRSSGKFPLDLMAHIKELGL